jgi:flagellar biosynthesis protein FlhF
MAHPPLTNSPTHHELSTMHLHTFRAHSLQEALKRVRDELGPDASVLHTRDIGSAWSRWLVGTQIEVTASAEVRAPSRLPTGHAESSRVTPADLLDFRRKFRDDLLQGDDAESSLVEQLSRSRNAASVAAFAAPQCHLDLPLADPIRIRPGRRSIVALVGPTGVGKTTTIAKLAAHFRLREHRTVGLITVDTFRIAAVEQLKTYAEIMDLPLAVVTSPREMPAAVDRLADVDLVLVDTAGRSPRDAVRLSELRTYLAQSQADEVHVVLSAVAGADSIDVAAGAFSTAGASALILTKLDEAVSLDWLPAILQRHRLPLSYTTHGQNVPDDIRPASAESLGELALTRR